MRVSLRLLPAALLLVLLLSDWPFGWLQKFWVSHAMLTGIVYTVLFVWLGFSAVNWWAEHRRAKQVKSVIATAYRACARIPLEQRRALWLIACGGKFVSDSDFRLPTQAVARIPRVLRRACQPAIDEVDVLARRTGAPDLVARLEVLYGRPEWHAACYETIRSVVHSSRVVLARWAPVMLSTPESTATHLKLVGSLQQLSNLYACFQPTWRSATPLERAAVVTLFVACLRDCVESHEMLLNPLLAQDGQASYTQGRLLLAGTAGLSSS